MTVLKDRTRLTVPLAPNLKRLIYYCEVLLFMLENLLCAAIAILAVWGSLALAYMLLMSLIRPKKNERRLLLLLSEGTAEDTVERVSFMLSRLSVSGELGYTVIAVLCDPADAEKRQALAAAFGREERVIVCSKTELMEMI